MRRTLKLNVKHKWFEVMVTGEKKFEYRSPSQWLQSRLKNPNYDFVEIRSGYGKTRPVFIAKCELIYHSESHHPVTMNFSNNLKVVVNWGDVIIKLGEIIKVENYAT